MDKKALDGLKARLDNNPQVSSQGDARMSEILGYVRVSTEGQSVESQKHELTKAHRIERWFDDSAVSGAVAFDQRPGGKSLLEYAREGDTVVVAAIDRLGRNTLDVLSTVEALKAKGVKVISDREGFDLSTPAGAAMLTMLAAIGELERSNIRARQRAGIERAKAEGRAIGRPRAVDPQEVVAWRNSNGDTPGSRASISKTAAHFGISITTVKTAMREAA